MVEEARVAVEGLGGVGGSPAAFANKERVQSVEYCGNLASDYD